VNWYLKQKGRVKGPFSIAEMKTMWEQGMINRFDLVSLDSKNWEPAADAIQSAAGPPIVPEVVTVIEEEPGLVPPPVPLASPGRHGTGTVRMIPFPTLVLVLLHFLTCGLFSFFWVTTMHGRLPRSKTDDLTSGKALAMALIPLLNLYCIFLVYPELARRINALRRTHGLPGSIPMFLPLTMCLFAVIPILLSGAGSIVLAVLSSRGSATSEAVWVFLIIPNVLTVINFFALVPYFCGLAQQYFNQLAHRGIQPAGNF